MLEYIKTRRAGRQTVHNCYTELSLLCHAGLSIHPVSWEEVLSSLWKSCEIEVVEITDNISTGLVKSISVFQRNNVSVWDLENYDYIPLNSALFVRIPDRIIPQDTSCCEDTWILHPGPLKGSIFTSIHTGQLHYVNLFFWLIIKVKSKMKFNTLRTVFRREEIRGELKTTLCKALLLFGNHLSLALFLMISSPGITSNAIYSIAWHYSWQF